MKHLIILALLAAALTAQAQKGRESAHLQIHNPQPTARPAQVLDLPLAEVRKQIPAPPATLVVKDHGTRLLTQLYASQPNAEPDRFLILVDLAANETRTLDLTSDPTAHTQESKVTARNVPERADDFAWENDKVAFRVYGPALERTGEIASGIDVWSKRVPDFITTSFYRRDEESQKQHNSKLSYHHDNGQGMDSYEVGLSRGDGGTAIWADGKLYASKNVVTSTILANGPIRTDFIFTYAPWPAGDSANAVSVTEVKRITLDAGSRMNHLRSTFTWPANSITYPAKDTIGISDTPPRLTVAAGLAIHDGADVTAATPANYIAVWDTPQTPAEAGRIATGLVPTPGTHPDYKQIDPQGKVDGNALELYTINNGASIDYYAGNGWSKADMPTPATWIAYLEDFHTRLTQPVTTKWLPTKK